MYRRDWHGNNTLKKYDYYMQHENVCTYFVLFIVLYEKRGYKKKHTKRPNSIQNIWCTKEKKAKNELTMKTKQDH